MTNATSATATAVKRIHWTKEEEIELIESLYVQTKARYPHITEDLSKLPLIMLIKEAQKVFPEDRQRTHKGVEQYIIRWRSHILAELKTLMKIMVSESPAEATTVSTEIAGTKALIPEISDDLATALRASTESLADTILSVVRYSLETQVDKMVEDLTASIGNKLIHSIAERQASIIKYMHQDLKVSVEKALSHKEKVLVVGLIPVQQEALQRECGEMFDIVFEEENPKMASAKAKHAFAVFHLVTKSNHSLENACKNHNRYIRVNGGLTSVKDALLSLYVEWSDSIKGRMQASASEASTQVDSIPSNSSATSVLG